jgi:pimeloyl-ACP methyl ester carboxylesterase
MNAFILLHGKHSGNQSANLLHQLSVELLALGLVDYQAYAWSSDTPGIFNAKAYDRPFETCIDQIDSAIVKLKNQGASQIFLVGHSMGANAALYYIAERINSVNGVILLAPAHNVHLSRFVKVHQWSIDHAKQLIDAGDGTVDSYFVDFTSDSLIAVIESVGDNYYSMMNPDGAANMKHNAQRLSWPANILTISGDKDTTQTYFFESVYLNLNNKSPLNRYVLVPNGTHTSICLEGTDRITNWISTI